MDELTIEGQTYLSSKRAAKVTGYAKDYVGQLCREGRVQARLVGRNWYVLEESIMEHRFGAEGTEAHNDHEVVASEPKSQTATWQEPRYSVETVTAVPTFEGRSNQSDQKQPEMVPDTLTDMQSAWKEWFETRKTALPEGEDVAVAHAEPISDTQAQAPAPVEEEETVHVSRLHEAERSPEPDVEAYQEEEEVRVEIVRSEPVRTAQRQSVRHEVVDIAHSADTRGTGTRMVLRALILGVALVTAAVALVGSGIADKYSRGGNGLIDLLSGKSEFDK